MTTCAACHRQLRRPSPDGLGPVCRRRLAAPQPVPVRSARPGPAPGDPLDHAALAAGGQLTIPVQAPLPLLQAVTPHRRRGRPIHTVPGPDTWPTTEETR